MKNIYDHGQESHSEEGCESDSHQTKSGGTLAAAEIRRQLQIEMDQLVLDCKQTRAYYYWRCARVKNRGWQAYELKVNPTSNSATLKWYFRYPGNIYPTYKIVPQTRDGNYTPTAFRKAELWLKHIIADVEPTNMLLRERGKIIAEMSKLLTKLERNHKTAESTVDRMNTNATGWY